MNRLARSAAAFCACLVAGSASADEAPRACLAEDLRLRLAWSEPERIVDAVQQVRGERKLAGKRAVLVRRFRDAGCATVEEQAGRGLPEPNVLCRIPGRTSASLAIGTGPQLDGWIPAALMPEIARAIASAPREHTYVLAVLFRTPGSVPSGARIFAESLESSPPRAFVHVGALGDRMPELGPEVSDTHRCIAQTLARSLGLEVAVRGAWPDASFACDRDVLSQAFRGGRPSLPRCGEKPLAWSLEFAPFVRHGIPVVTWSALPEGDRSEGEVDPATLVATYRLLAAHAVALDQALDEGPGR